MLENLKAFIRHGKQANDIRKKEISHPQNFVHENFTTATSNVHAGGEFGRNEHEVKEREKEKENRERREDMEREREANTAYVDDVGVALSAKEAAAEIVEQERRERRQKSKYPQLEAYEVLEQMGEGAFSVVHRAKHISTGQQVAVKILRKFQMDKAQQMAVLKEVAIMRQLDHPNIVRFVEFIDSEPYYYIVQELAVGGEIFSAIVKYTYFSEDLTRHIITQVAEAVRYLHEEVGIVHRDIKPENLLFMPIDVTPSLNPIAKLRRSDDPATKRDEGEFVPGVGGGGIGLVKVADFGLSKQIWEHNTKTPCGTVGYTAPEIVRDERYSKEVDMWALGCVLYTLLCGFPPFYDERIETLTEKVARGEYTFLSPWWDEISSEAKHCVGKLLTVDPSMRYTIDDFLNDPWMNEKNEKKSMEKPVDKTERKYEEHPINKYSRDFDEGYSPAAAALRDVFDISTAVHRMGEEAALSTRLKDQRILEEDEEEEYRVEEKGMFTLNMGGASILERRKNKPREEVVR